MSMSTAEVGKKLVELCQRGENLTAVETLYADDIVSVEAMSMQGEPRETHGKAGCRAKNEWWFANMIFHGGKTDGPFVFDDKFAAVMEADVTNKATGQRMTMREVAVYTVKNGKIVREEFMYAQD